jgi:hypothetical protein
MAEHRISLMPKRLVDFARVPSGASLTHVVADQIDIIPWRELTLLVNVHGHSLASGSGTITVCLLMQSVSLDDPSLEFIVPGIGNELATVTLNGATPTPCYLSIPCASFAAAMAQLVVIGTRASAGSLDAQLSMSLSAKA